MAKPTARKQIGEVVNDGADNERRKYVEAARRDSSRRHPGTSAKSVIYGEYPDEQLLFIPEPRARFLAQVWRAMVQSTTWAELKRLAPPAAYREIRRRNEDLDPAELRADAPFYYYDMTSVPDGDYPGFPKQEMFSWMPRDIQLDFGTAESTSINGELLTFDPKDTKAIVQRLRQAGFQCRRNQRLIEQAHGD